MKLFGTAQSTSLETKSSKLRNDFWSILIYNICTYYWSTDEYRVKKITGTSIFGLGVKLYIKMSSQLVLNLRYWIQRPPISTKI